MIWGERWEGGSGLGTHVHPWLIHVNVWQNQYSIVKQNKVKIKIIKKKSTKCFLSKRTRFGYIPLLYPIKLKSKLFCLYVLSSVTKNKNFQNGLWFCSLADRDVSWSLAF